MPIVIQRSSPDLSSRTDMAYSSSNAVTASAKRTPCLRRFALALAGSHSTAISVYYCTPRPRHVSGVQRKRSFPRLLPTSRPGPQSPVPKTCPGQLHARTRGARMDLAYVAFTGVLKDCATRARVYSPAIPSISLNPNTARDLRTRASAGARAMLRAMNMLPKSLPTAHSALKINGLQRIWLRSETSPCSLKIKKGAQFCTILPTRPASSASRTGSPAPPSRIGQKRASQRLLI